MVFDWALVFAAYCIGSVPFAYLVPRALAGIDVRTSGSRNVGAANVLRTTRVSVALSVVALDIAKGASAVFLARAAGAEATGLAGTGAAAG